MCCSFWEKCKNSPKTSLGCSTPLNCFQFIESNLGPKVRIPGGTDLERGYGDVRPWRPPFHASPAARKGPISSKRVSSQDPLRRNFGNFSLYSLNFHSNFSSRAPKFGNFQLTSPKFGNFQLTSPQIWKFSAHKPPFSETNVSSQAPHFGNPGRTPLPEKSWVPLPGVRMHKIVRPDLELDLVWAEFTFVKFGTFNDPFFLK